MSADAARAQSKPAAAAQEVGDLFEYKLKEPVTIRKNQSAMVPILQTDIAAEKVSIWNESLGNSRPQRALWLTNSSSLTLDGGSFSIVEEETFAGEGIFEPIRPGEKRLVSYATDLALTASSRSESEHQRVTKVRVSRGVMTQHSEVREKKTYAFRNEDAAPRTLIVEHPARPGYELRSQTQPVEISPAWMRFRVVIEPKKTAVLTVEEGRPVEASYTLAKLSVDQVGVFVRERSVNKEVEEALRKIVRQKAVLDALEEKKAALESESERIYDDQQRVSENLKSLKGSAEEKALVQRYTSQLNTQEDRLEALRKEISSLEDEQQRTSADLDRFIDAMTFDASL